MAEKRVLLSDVPGLGSVSLCNCGSIHLSVGPLTVRLAPEVFRQVLAMCSDAQSEMNDDPALLCQNPANSFMH